MPDPMLFELRVGVDVGSRSHAVAIGLSSGAVLEEFEIAHTSEGFGDFFSRVEAHANGRAWGYSAI